MKVAIEKKGDGASVLRCVRSDGSVTWQRHEGHQGAFFPLHDLTHLAVEGALSRTDGFFGLVASGWEIEETTGKTARGPLPPGALEVERLVGLFDLERGGVASWQPADVGLSDDDVRRVRERMRELLARWEALPAGGTLELAFDG